MSSAACRIVQETFAARITDLGCADQLHLQEPLARYTSYGIGGPADILMIAKEPDQIRAWVAEARACGMPHRVLGGGTNILVADAGIRGLIIINDCAHREIDDQGLLVCESGHDLAALAHWAVSEGWDGLTWAVGVPGTLGGAIVGNAGAYGGCIADSVCWVRVLTSKTQVEQWPAKALQYRYRYSILKDTAWANDRPVVLQAALQMRPADPNELARQAQAINAKRRERTPAGSCAGSVFKRTLQYPAGYLIDQAGLKGMRVGDAVVSPKHANFVMNNGKATAQDIRTLIERVKAIISERYGIQLEREIEYVGQWQVAAESEATE